MFHILIAGKDHADLLANLRQMLQVVKECVLCLKKEKCLFMTTEIVYLGFLINSEGVASVKSKLDPYLKFPSPTNVTELKSFLGILNYYHRQLPNLAEVLEPFYRSIRKGSE